MRHSIKGIAEGPRKLSQLLKASVGIPNSADGPEEDHWVVGGRYQVLRPVSVHARPDLSSDRLGTIRAKETVLLLALQQSSERAGAGEVLLAYIANTKNTDWVCGWGQIESAASGGADAAPVLRRRRVAGSWEVGGRYIVNGSPVLRTQIELESDQMCEIQPNDEALVLDLGLVIKNGEPRLRARVRTDLGDQGWLTIELPGGSSLLDPLSLYSAEALQRKASYFGERHRRSGLSKRVTVNGQSESANQAWEMAGKYRLVERVTVTEDADLNSRVIGELRKGSLVAVRGIDHLTQTSGVPLLRLQISNEHTDAIGWMCPLNQHGEKLLDSRDHMEFERLMRLQQLSLEQAEQEAALSPFPPTETNPQGSDVPPWVQQETENINPLGLDQSPSPMEQHAAAVDETEASSSPIFYQQVSSPRDDRESPTDHATSSNAHADARQNNKCNPGNNVSRPWELGHGAAYSSGYRTMQDLDRVPDERQVGDNLENEGLTDFCACRDGLLSCGAFKRVDAFFFQDKSPSAPQPYGGMIGEPAPEPRPMQQVPTPPGIHATSLPKDYYSQY